MTNETKQPTLPEAIALAREALNHAQNQTYPFGGLELFAKALAALDSLQVGEPVTDHIEDVRGMVPVETLAEQIAGAISKHMTVGLYPRELIAAAQYIAHRYCHTSQPADCPRCRPGGSRN